MTEHSNDNPNTGTDTDPLVLIVEDEPDVATSYELWLRDAYGICRAETGEEALEILDNRDVDVVLLDRMLPGISGDEVLAAIRDRGLDCRVAMVSAVSPGIEVAEMGFDGYVTKPPGPDELRNTVERLVDRGTLDDDLQEYYSLVARRSALETEFGHAELVHHEQYRALVDRIERQRASVDASMDDLDDAAGFVGAVRAIDPTDGELPNDGTDGGTDDGTNDRRFE
ncbi:response regulator [Halosimplex halophilum]|uniref:response regulator n=1 Tax=Halosimplex halophilum TaxID=2559572 RepID=UPI00107FAC6B|nr:response regulator [Halosimplex halophilum]